MDSSVPANLLELKARFGRRWWQTDIGWYVIRGLKSLRLASDVKLPKEFRKLGSGIKREMDRFSSPFVISEGKESPR
jgi:hypothetical protein